MKNNVSKAGIQLKSYCKEGNLMPSRCKIYDELVIGQFQKFSRFLWQKKTLCLPQEEIQEWWIPQDDSSAGSLKFSSKGENILYGNSNNMIEQIILRTPEKVILAYNGVSERGCWKYIEFLGNFWKNREKIKSALYLYIPKKSYFSCIDAGREKFEEENFHHILFDKSSTMNLRPYTDYINYESSVMPFFDLEKKEFDLVDFYDFCCRKLAYIIKTAQLFPRLDCGMSDFNFRDWKVFTKEIIFNFNLHSEYNCYHGQSLRLWKLLDVTSMKERFGWLPLNSFCRDKNYDFCWHQFFPVKYGNCTKMKKNRLSKAIYQKEKYGSEFEFLFPLILFLGHYAQCGNIECCIPEYNFHELINALILLIQGKDIPELLPDFPGEEEISLEAYRQGIIKLPPACKDYYCNENQIIAEFKNADTAYGFLEQIYAIIDGEICYADKCGKIIFKDISDRDALLSALDDAKTKYREYPINMWLWDGSVLRKMTLQEILTAAAEQILRHFPNDYREAVHYLENLSVKFKNQYQRYSTLRSGHLSGRV